MFKSVSSPFSKLTGAAFTRTGRTAAVLAGAAVLAVSLTAAHSAGATRSISHSGFTFRMVRTPGVPCLGRAGATVNITRGSLNETMTISVHGLPKNSGFDLFVIETPNKPFGMSWYQTDVHTNKEGKGTATVRGIFSKETFSVDPAIPVAPVHQFHLGLWFNSPSKPFNLGCEPGASVPIVTPFNGVQHAGIQILNTSNFHGLGPLSHVG
jgi:hypothetical protein